MAPSMGRDRAARGHWALLTLSHLAELQTGKLGISSDGNLRLLSCELGTLSPLSLGSRGAGMFGILGFRRSGSPGKFHQARRLLAGSGCELTVHTWASGSHIHNLKGDAMGRAGPMPLVLRQQKPGRVC